MFRCWLHVVLPTIVGILLLSYASWTLLLYEPIRHLVTIEQAASQPAPYDYIIVGAGTVGCVLAARLSANSNTSVLLIEAGRQFGPLSSVPLLALTMQRSAVDWAHRSTVQQHSSFGLYDRVQFLPRGKGLGGSGQLNFALHYDGANGEDFERWAGGESGAKGWDAKEMRGYLRRLLRADGEEGESTVRSEPHDPAEGLSKMFRAMKKELGAELPGIRFDPAASNTRRGQRWNSYHTHLRPALERPNLHILYGTRVHRVIFNDHKRAIGVRVAPDDQPDGVRARTHLLRARREIIISAGAYGTPQLLQLSGIGERQHLEPFGIDVVAALPAVGANLHEHLTVPVYVAINESMSLTPAKVMSVAEVWRYLRHGQGWLSRFGVVGFVNDWRGGHSVGVFGAGAMNEEVLRDVANTRSFVFREQYPMWANQSSEGFVLLNMCLQPRSRGTVRLNSRSARVRPLIDPRYLEEEEDVRCTIRWVRFVWNSVIVMAYFLL